MIAVKDALKYTLKIVCTLDSLNGVRVRLRLSLIRDEWIRLGIVEAREMRSFCDDNWR